MDSILFPKVLQAITVSNLTLCHFLLLIIINNNQVTISSLSNYSQHKDDN